MKKSLFICLLCVLFTLPTIGQEFRKGETLQWKTGAGWGKMVVTSVNGNNFTMNQFNEANRAAGAVKLTGEIKRNGEYVIYNRKWNETWRGVRRNGKIEGRVNNRTTFYITLNNHNNGHKPKYIGNCIFKVGQTFVWKTKVSYGTIKVVSVNGNSFVLTQYNDTNISAGGVRLEGYCDNGRYTIKNHRYHETWIGTERGNSIEGRINNSMSFSIYGKQGRSDGPKNAPKRNNGHRR